MRRWRRMAAALAVAWTQGAAGGEAMPPPEAAVAPPGSAPPFRDPFAMRGGSGEDEYVAADVGAIPQGIRVVAILSVEGKPSVGALSIPGAHGLHFVREGEVIQLDVAGKATGAPPTQQLYLLVKSISDEEIEIAPRARPQDARVYR
jgi:hypothetical protein